MRCETSENFHNRPNQSEPTAGRRGAPVYNFMKVFSVFAALALASGGSAPSR
jgi:hypothetical protein